MADYKVIDAEQLEADLGAVADAIRAKGGTTAAMAFPEGFEAAVEAISEAAPEAVEQATPSITVSTSGLITATVTQTEGFVEAGTKSVTKQLSTKAGATITPGTSSKVAVSQNVYTTGDVYVQGDADLVAANIKSGVSIFGVEGTYSGSGSGGGSTLPDGFTELKGGTVVFSSDTSSVSVEHGLSGFPKGALFYREGPANSTETYLNWAYIYPFKYYNTSTGGSFLGALLLSNGPSTRTISGTGTETSPKTIITVSEFLVYGGSYNYTCKGGETYRWLAWR